MKKCKKKYKKFNGKKENFDLKEKSFAEMNEFEANLKKKTSKIYNNFNLETIKLFKLLLNFGLFEVNSKEKSEFLSVLSHLLKIFEFDKNYPEGQILLDRSRKSIISH